MFTLGSVRARIYIGGVHTILNHMEFGGAHIIHAALGGQANNPAWCWPAPSVAVRFCVFSYDVHRMNQSRFKVAMMGSPKGPPARGDSNTKSELIITNMNHDVVKGRE